MSEKAFTAGPYTVKGGKYIQIMFPKEWHNGVAGKMETEDVIATVYGTKDDANRLSAAPEMYEALKKVNESQEWDYLEDEVQEAVAKALGKAEGWK